MTKLEPTRTSSDLTATERLRRMLWNPEYRNGESPWVSGCKLNYCPNCGRRIEVDA